MKITLELNKDEIELALKKYIELEYNKNVQEVSFKIRDVSDDRFGGGPNHQLISADIIVTGNIR